MADLQINVKIDESDMKRLEASLGRVSKSASTLSSQRIISNLASRSITEAINLTTRLTSEITNLGLESIRLAADFQTTTNALAVFTGSTRTAKAELAAIDQIALNTTGLRLESAEKGYERLRALGFQADITTKFIKGIANQKLLSGADNAAVDRVIVNLTQIRASSKDASRDIKEMIKAIPSLSGVFEDTFGTSSTSELRKLLQENPKEFFNKFATGLSIAEQAQGGLNESIAKGGDAFIELGRTLGEPILDPLTTDIKELTEYIRQNKKEVGEWGEYLANVYRGVSAIANNSNKSTNEKLLGFAVGGGVGASGNLGSLFKMPGTLGFAGNTLETLGRNQQFEINLRGGYAKQISQLATDIAKEQKAKQREADRARMDVDEETHKSLLDSFQSFKNERLSIAESLYKAEESRLKSHLDYTTEQQLVTAKTVAASRKSSIQTQISITEDYYDKLLKFGDLDREENIKFGREKNVALAKLNGELRTNEFNTQREILEFEKRISDERRDTAIGLKKLQIEQTNFGFDNQIFDIEKLLSNQFVSASSGFDKLIELTQKSYQETSRLTIESYQLQLQDLSLTKEKRFNLTSEMFLSEQKLAEENRRKIQQIEDEKFQNSLENFKRQNEQVIKLSQNRGQLFSQLQGSFFSNSVNFGDGFPTFGVRALSENGDKEMAIDLNLKLNNVLQGRTSIYTFQSSLLEKTQLLETTNLQRQIDLNKDLVDLERIRLKYVLESNVANAESQIQKLTVQRGNVLDSNPEEASRLFNQAEDISKRVADWKKILTSPEADLNKYLDSQSVTTKKLNNDIQDLTASMKNLGIAQAGAKQDLFSESAEGLKQLFDQIKSGQKDKIIQDIEERNFLKEKISLITENKSLEQKFYENSEYLALQRKNKLLQFDREIFELRQELADKSLFSQVESDAKVLRFLNDNIKSVSESFADFRIGLGETYLNAVTSPFDALEKKLEGLNPIVRGLAQTFLDLGRDIVKAFSQKFLMRLLGLESGGASSGGSSGGGFSFSGIINGIRNFFGGGSGSRSSSVNSSTGSLRPDDLTDAIQQSAAIFGNGRGSNGSGGSSGFSSIFGSEGFGNNVGTYGAVGAGAGILGGLVGGRVGGFISGAGAGLGIGAQIGSMIMPGLGTALGAGIGALAGGLMSLLGGDPKRKRDKNEKLPALNKGFADALAQLRALGADKNAFYANPEETISKAMELRGQIASGFGIQMESKKYRAQSQSLIASKLAEADGIIAELNKLKDRASRARDVDSMLHTSFAGGVYMESSFMSQFGEFKRRNGFLTGGIAGKDSLPSLLMPKEIVLNEQQQQRIRIAAGHDIFQDKGIPHYAGGTYVASNVTGAYLAPSASQNSSNTSGSSSNQPPEINFSPNITIVVEGEIDKARIKDVLITSLQKDSKVKVEVANANAKGGLLNGWK